MVTEIQEALLAVPAPRAPLARPVEPTQRPGLLRRVTIKQRLIAMAAIAVALFAVLATVGVTRLQGVSAETNTVAARAELRAEAHVAYEQYLADDDALNMYVACLAVGTPTVSGSPYSLGTTRAPLRPPPTRRSAGRSRWARARRSGPRSPPCAPTSPPTSGSASRRTPSARATRSPRRFRSRPSRTPTSPSGSLRSSPRCRASWTATSAT